MVIGHNNFQNGCRFLMGLTKSLRFIVILLLITGWVFSGWPQFFNFPPKVQEARAAIGFVDATNASARNTTTIAVGSWTATSGNLLVLICSADANATFTDPSGWTSIRTDSSANGSMETYFKASDGLETTVTCTKTEGGNTEIYGIVLEYSGVDASAVSASLGANGSGDATAECPSITPSGNNVYIAGVMFLNANIGAPALSWASDAFNERVDAQLGAGPGTARENYGAADFFTSSGTRQTVVTLDGGGSHGWVCQTISFNETVSTPELTQNAFEFWVDNALLIPTDIWGNPDIPEKVALDAVPPSNDPIDPGDEIRIRMQISVTVSDLTAGDEGFILAYSEANDCTTVSSWTDVDVAAGGGTWVFSSDTDVADNATLTTLLVSGSETTGRYNRSDPTSTTPNTVTAGQELEWDWHIVYNSSNAAGAKTYCFRMERDDGTELNTYNSDSYPRIDTRPATADQLRHGNFFTGGIERGFFWTN